METRRNLPPLPKNMRELPVDERGYPVPFFVAWPNDKPDHRITDQKKLYLCVKNRLCWVCGKPIIDATMNFVVGPMCVVNRISSEPPSHMSCAIYAVRTCPFMTHSAAQRRDVNKPNGVKSLGIMLKRNPGVQALWSTCIGFKAIPARFNEAGEGEGILFQMGEPRLVMWWREGKVATPEEVRESVESGLPALVEAAEAGGPEACRELANMVEEAKRFLPTRLVTL